MGAETGIAWTDHTFNPWWGCEKVSPGCAHCYAEAWDARWNGGHWGKDSPRRFFGDKHWNEPRTWNAAALKAGRRARVFCASMADVFEDRTDLEEERNRLFRLIRETPQLDWQLLTKRPENILRLLPPGVVLPWPNVWLGTTVEDQKRADERIPELLKVPAAVRFLSVEPLLERVHLRKHLARLCSMCEGSASVPVPGGGAACPRCFDVGQFQDPDQITWVIVGGESDQPGQPARPCALEWIEAVVAQCKAAGVPAFVKQLGSRFVTPEVTWQLHHGGADPDLWPPHLRVRGFPNQEAP